MKKIIFALLALVGTMSMNAQVMKVMKNGKVVKTYWNEEADEVVFEEGPFGQGSAATTGFGYVKWIQLWEGGPKFAEYNVGVSDDKAESNGYHYAWGGSQDKVDDHNTGSAALSGETDTVTKLWGSNWRMPTQAELNALLSNCTCTWTSQDGVNGLLCKGKDAYADNSVFLPAAGWCYNGSILGFGIRGYYWASTSNISGSVYRLLINSSDPYVGLDTPDNIYSVRAVLNE